MISLSSVLPRFYTICMAPLEKLQAKKKKRHFSTSVVNKLISILMNSSIIYLGKKRILHSKSHIVKERLCLKDISLPAYASGLSESRLALLVPVHSAEPSLFFLSTGRAHNKEEGEMCHKSCAMRYFKLTHTWEAIKGSQLQ